MGELFNAALYQPIFNFFVWLYNVLPGNDVGVVILIITLLIRLILYPLTKSSIAAQKAMQDLQPKMDELKKLYPNDKQKQAQATMELYKTNKISPFSSCLPMLVQFPVLIALFLVLRDTLGENPDFAGKLYSFVAHPGAINPISLGLFNLGDPSIPLAILAGVAQFLQAKTLSRKKPPALAGAGGKDEGLASMMNKQMLYFMPVLTVIIGLQFPAGLTLYWFLTTALMLLQQLYMFRHDRGGGNDGDKKAIVGEVV